MTGAVAITVGLGSVVVSIMVCCTYLVVVLLSWEDIRESACFVDRLHYKRRVPSE